MIAWPGQYSVLPVLLPFWVLFQPVSVKVLEWMAWPSAQRQGVPLLVPVMTVVQVRYSAASEPL